MNSSASHPLSVALLTLRRLLVWVGGFALIGVVAWLAFREPPVLVDVAVVRRGPMRVTVEEDGVTRIRERYVVSTPLAGRLLRITHDVGDAVVATETVLARMEPTDAELLDPRAVAQARARVRAAERRLDQAESERERVKALANFAEREMGKLRRLRKSAAASEKEFLEQELEFQQQQERLRSADYAVEIAQYELDLEKAALMLTQPDEATKDASDFEQQMMLTIAAPISGRILRIYQESTATIEAGTPLLEVGDPSDLEIVADVLSRDAVKVNPGDPVLLERWGGEEPLNGRVRLIEPSGFMKVSALGVEEQRVNVIIDFLEPPEHRTSLGDNFRVDCQIIVWETSDTLRIPSSALFRVGEDWHTFVVRAGQAQRVPVDVGHDNGEVTEILGGLTEGEVVIVYPGDAVSEGVMVAPRT